MNAPRTVTCPRCGVAVAWTVASKWRPFCSERCRTIDQAAWASESYRVPAVDLPGDLDTSTPTDDG
jgi:endogenous inhibitor of DNA gyrase (YacG/DUF329 family)